MFDRILNPSAPEAMDNALAEGKIYGWIEGLVVDDHDPRGLGRVQVECPTIAPNVVLPNGTEGWVEVSTTFVTNATPGGTHHPLPIGSQVIMMARLGDPRRMIVIGSMPSTVDRPYPEHDRSQGKHGAVTTGGVIEVNDDTVSSQVIARPNGVVQKISGEGDLVYQTEEHGRLELMQDGTSSISNDNVFTSHAPDGTLTQQNAAGAVAILEDSGQVEVQASDGSRLTLTGIEGKLEGPFTAMTTALNSLQESFSGYIGEGQEALTALQGLAEEYNLGGDVEGFLAQAQGKLSSLQDGIDKHFDTGMAALEKLQEFEVQDFAQVLGPQADRLLQVAPVISDIENIVSAGDGLAIAQAAADTLGADIDVEQLAQVLDGLDFDPELQIHAILEEVAPAAFDEIKNVMGLKIHKILPLLSELTDSSTLPELETFVADPNDIRTFDEILEAAIGDRATALSDSLPEFLQGLTTPELIHSLVDGSTENPIHELMGSVVSGMVADASTTIAESEPVIREIQPVTALFDAIATGEQSQIEAARNSLPATIFTPDPDGDPVADAIQNAMPGAIAALAERLAPTMTTIADKVNDLADAIPDGLRGATVRANELVAQMETTLGPLGPIVEANQTSMMAELKTLATTVYARESSAGITSPYGSFGFSAGGGSMLSDVKMAMQVAQSGSKSAGLVMDPDDGASLSSFNDRHALSDDDRWLEINETARISVDDGIVRIESKSGEHIHNYIEVGPNDVLINGRSLRYWDDELDRIHSRLASIEAAQAAAAAPPATPDPSP